MGWMDVCRKKGRQRQTAEARLGVAGVSSSVMMAEKGRGEEESEREGGCKVFSFLVSRFP